MKDNVLDELAKNKKKPYPKIAKGMAYSKDDPFANMCPKCGHFGFQHDARASDKKRDIYVCLWEGCKYGKAVPTTSPVGKPADDRCCAMPGTVMCCKNIAPVCETCGGSKWVKKTDAEKDIYDAHDMVSMSDLYKPCPKCQQHKEVEDE